MDPITHGLLGATVAQVTMGKRIPRGAALIGAVGAMAADADVFIWSANDPTVSWVYHRHFTHALAFIPLGGWLAALPFLWLARYRLYRVAVVVAAMIGYATHTLLDSLTNYGTQQLLPFADTRVTWDAMPIVDPVYSLILLAGLALAARSRWVKAARWSLALSLLYVLFGFWQHQRAVEVQNELLALRHQQATQARVLPAPGWLILWRSIYLADGKLYADGIRLPWLGKAGVLMGASADAVTLSDLPAVVQANPAAQRQFKILAWFAGGYLAAVAGDAANIVGDMRLTTTLEGLTPMWGLQFNAQGAPQRWVSARPSGREVMRALLWGDERYQPLPPRQH